MVDEKTYEINTGIEAFVRRANLRTQVAVIQAAIADEATLRESGDADLADAINSAVSPLANEVAEIVDRLDLLEQPSEAEADRIRDLFRALLVDDSVGERVLGAIIAVDGSEYTIANLVKAMASAPDIVETNLVDNDPNDDMPADVVVDFENDSQSTFTVSKTTNPDNGNLVYFYSTPDFGGSGLGASFVREISNENDFLTVVRATRPSFDLGDLLTDEVEYTDPILGA